MYILQRGGQIKVGLRRCGLIKGFGLSTERAHDIINYNSYCFSRFHLKKFKVQIREILTHRNAHIFFTAQSIFFYF
jgi:hypothetical protein